MSYLFISYFLTLYTEWFSNYSFIAWQCTPRIRGGMQSVNFGKRQTVGHQLLGNIEVCCTFRSIAIAWGVCEALSSHFNIALFVRGHLYLGPGHTGILRAIIPNSGDSCSVSVTSTYKYKIIRYHCHLSKHFMQRTGFQNIFICFSRPYEFSTLSAYACKVFITQTKLNLGRKL